MIDEYIISVHFLKSKFTHHNIKYLIGKLIDNTIYKFKLKLVKYSLYEAYNKNNVLMYMFLKETII
jgi:hypothetical protein